MIALLTRLGQKLKAVPPREVGKVLSVGNQTASGALAAVVTDVRVIAIAQTTTGVALTLPSPGDVSVVAGVDVINVGAAAFSLYGVTVAPTSMMRCTWTGTTWAPDLTSGNPPRYTVAALPTTGAVTLAYATNGRANAGVAVLGGGFAVQPAGAGTGCLVTWCASSSVWQIAGTTTTVAA